MIEGIKVGFSNDVILKATENVRKVLTSGRLIYDEFIPKFENILKRITGQDGVALFSSDTAAQEILFKCLPQLHGRCIAFQANGFPSPAFAAIRAGLHPVWVDIDPFTLDVKIEHLELMFSRYDIAALNLMSTGGMLPNNIQEIKKFCEKHRVILIDDAAHSFGSVKGTYVAGGWADYSIFSFYATKPMCMGEGGAIVSERVDILEKCSSLARYGRREMFGVPICDEQGYSCRPTELLCAVGCAIYEGFSETLEKRRNIGDLYIDKLKDSQHIHLYDYTGSNFYKFPILIKKEFSREDLFKFFHSNGVKLSAGVYDFPTYKQPAFEELYSGHYFIGAEKFCKNHVCLPMHEFLSEIDVNLVVELLQDYVEAA